LVRILLSVGIGKAFYRVAAHSGGKWGGGKSGNSLPHRNKLAGP
jgi:hypothetical protein